MSDTPETTSLLSTKKDAAAKKKADLLNLLTWASENGDPEHKAIARSLLPQPKPPKPIKKKPLDVFRDSLGAMFEAFQKLYKKHLDREEEGRLWILAMTNESSGQPGKLFLLGRGPTPPDEWQGYVPLRRKS